MLNLCKDNYASYDIILYYNMMLGSIFLLGLDNGYNNINKHR